MKFLLAEQDRIGREVEAFIEENTGEDGRLDGATTDAGNVTQAAVRGVASGRFAAAAAGSRRARHAGGLPGSHEGGSHGEEGGRGMSASLA